eukprot:TRINITY_DN1159_c1_g1_i1.p1 TRINITY_DN1159_c1_g1~~TRINITY_DN1159_c1_g1_i1.p1  ORF type:complete len:346 (+),score=35.68 TRINITY_DN1159_c1_g1_i1:134-1171(+)
MALPKSLTLLLLLLASVTAVAILCWIRKVIKKRKAKKNSGLAGSPIEKGLMQDYRATKAMPPTPPSLLDAQSHGTEPQRSHSPLRRQNSVDSMGTDYQELLSKYHMPGSPGGPKPPSRSVSPSTSVPRKGSAYSALDRSGASSPPVRHFRRSSAPCNFVSLQEISITPQNSSGHLRSSTPTSYQKPPLSQPPPGPEFYVGERVQINDDIDYLRSISNAAGGGLKWHPAKQACIGQWGTVEAIDEKDGTVRVMMLSGRGFWFPERALLSDSPASRKNSDDRIHRKNSGSLGDKQRRNFKPPIPPLKIQTPGSLPQGVTSHNSTPINSPRGSVVRTPSLPPMAIICT